MDDEIHYERGDSVNSNCILELQGQWEKRVPFRNHPLLDLDNDVYVVKRKIASLFTKLQTWKKHSTLKQIKYRLFKIVFTCILLFWDRL